MKHILSLLFLLYFSFSYSQHLFPQKYQDCTTTRFKLENDSIEVTTDPNDLRATLRNELPEKVLEKIKGKLTLQILVFENGECCLLSLKNETNIKTKKLNLKSIIENKIKWGAANEPISATVLIEFLDRKIGIARLGLNANTGWKKINN